MSIDILHTLPRSPSAADEIGARTGLDGRDLSGVRIRQIAVLFSIIAWACLIFWIYYATW